VFFKHIAIPEGASERSSKWQKFQTIGIAVHPQTGQLLLLHHENC
jgi:hypothetical protein